MHTSHVVLAHLIALLPQSPTPSTTGTGTGKSGGGGYGSLIFIVLIAVVAYFLLIRPQRNRAKQAEAMRSDIEPGVEVLTRHGQHAKVISVNEDGTLTLEIAPGVYSKFVKEAVARVLTPTEDEQELSSDAPDIETIHEPEEPPAGGPSTGSPDDETKPGADS